MPPDAEEELFATGRRARVARTGSTSSASRGRRGGARRLAHRARRGPRHPLGAPHRAARAGAPRRTRAACSSRAPSRSRSGASPTATPTSGCASAGSACVDGLLAGRFAGLGGGGGAARGGRAARRRRAPATAWSRRARRSRAGRRMPRRAPLGGRAIDGAAPVGRRRSASARASCCCRCRPSSSDAAAREFASALVGGDAASVDRLVLSVGAARRRARRAARLGAGGDRPRARAPRAGARLAASVLRVPSDRPLMRLVTSLRDDHRLLRHSERMLAPLIEYDLARGGDLLDVLGAMLAHPGEPHGRGIREPSVAVGVLPAARADRRPARRRPRRRRDAHRAAPGAARAPQRECRGLRPASRHPFTCY